jgi:hypothetical protein
MTKYNVRVEVDTKKLRQETTNKTDSVRWLVENEFGWLNSSGIYFKEMEQVQKNEFLGTEYMGLASRTLEFWRISDTPDEFFFVYNHDGQDFSLFRTFQDVIAYFSGQEFQRYALTEKEYHKLETMDVDKLKLEASQ